MHTDTVFVNALFSSGVSLPPFSSPTFSLLSLSLSLSLSPPPPPPPSLFHACTVSIILPPSLANSSRPRASSPSLRALISGVPEAAAGG